MYQKLRTKIFGVFFIAVSIRKKKMPRCLFSFELQQGKKDFGHLAFGFRSSKILRRGKKGTKTSFQNNYVYLMTGVTRIVGVALFLDSDKSRSWLFVTAVNDTVEEFLFNNFWMQFFSWCSLILGTLRLHIEHSFQFSGISVLWWELMWAM